MSARLTLTLSDACFDELREAASNRGMSIFAFIRDAVAADLARRAELRAGLDGDPDEGS